MSRMGRDECCSIRTPDGRLDITLARVVVSASFQSLDCSSNSIVQIVGVGMGGVMRWEG